MEQSSTNEEAQLGQGRTDALDLGIVAPLLHLHQAFSGCCLPSCPRVYDQRLDHTCALVSHVGFTGTPSAESETSFFPLSKSMSHTYPLPNDLR